MKKNILSILVLGTFLIITACKNNKENEAEATHIAEIQKAIDTSITAAYNVDTNTSVIEWIGSKPIGSHSGTIRLSSGKIDVEKGVFNGGKFTIDMNSIAVTDISDKEGKADLEAHLKGTIEEQEDHFFNVKQYPEGTFEITQITTDIKNITPPSEFSTIKGKLTLKGVTNIIKFPAIITVNDTNVSIVSTTFPIDRTLWNIHFGSKTIFDNLGDKFIDDKIKIKVSIHAIK